uniref:C-type lectin domain family 2 member D2 like 1 n=1 Tax=Rattus norvegicus TaxID=10116 RepID=A0A8J8YB25_RAT
MLIASARRRGRASLHRVLRNRRKRPYSMSSSAHLQDAPPLLSGTLTQNEGQTSLRQSSSCGPSAASASESLSGYTESRIPHSKVRQGKGLRSIFPESRVKRYCCYGGVITVVAIAIVVPLSVTLSVKQMEQTSINNTFAASINNTSAASINNTSAACPSNWTEYGNKCFYFSEYTSNWTFSKDFCAAQGAELARFDTEEELNFLKRYKGSSGYWIGLHRESSEHPWKWTDNTQYNNLVPIRGDGQCGFLSDQLNISSSRVYVERPWICSKPKKYISQSQ